MQITPEPSYDETCQQPGAVCREGPKQIPNARDKILMKFIDWLHSTTAARR
jgi:hypothetical protein